VSRLLTPAARRAVLATLALLCAVAPVHAQGSLGGQRAGTASATFLRIGVGARAVGMGETFVAVANDPSAIYWNPAGLASLQRREFAISHVQWPADIQYDHMTLILPSRRLGGSVALQFGILGTNIDETTELQPFGTGRTFSYSDMVAGVAFSRRWTDKLLVGTGIKFVREDLGSQVGGPTTQAFLFDVGSIYYLGLGSVRIATSLTNFGASLRPSGRAPSRASVSASPRRWESGTAAAYRSSGSPPWTRWAFRGRPGKATCFPSSTRAGATSTRRDTGAG